MDDGVPPAAVDFPPEFRARYEILGQLGHGGTSYVFEARQKNLDRRVAIKVLRITDDFEVEDIERLVREGKILATMRHPRILSIYDSGYAGPLPYLAFELVEGESLAALVERERVPLRRALEIVHAVADALTYAHEHGTTHRDVKPENVLLLPGGDLKLADFGLARQAAGGRRLTADGVIMGTPSYMSPEQIAGPTLGPESDQYSLGICAYELVMGLLPFAAESPLERAFLRLKTDATPPRRLNPALPAAVDELIVTALNRDPARRFLTMAHMREAVARAMERLGPEGDTAFVPAPRNTRRLAVPRRTGVNPVLDPLAISRKDVTVPLGASQPGMNLAALAGRSTRGVPVLTRAVPVVPPQRPHRRAVLGAALLALLVALLATVRPGAEPDAAAGRAIRLRPRRADAPGELVELARSGDALVVRVSTALPLALEASLDRPLGHDATATTEHEFSVDPAQVGLPSRLTLRAPGLVPIRVEVPALRDEYRKIRHRVEMEPRWEPLREVLDEWNRAGEKGGLARVEKMLEVARTRRTRLLELAPFLLDCPALELEDVHWVYDRLAAMRALDTFRAAYGLPLLGADRALGRTFAVGEPGEEREAASAAGGWAVHMPLPVATVSVVDASDLLAGDLSRPVQSVKLTVTADASRVARAVLELDMKAPRDTDLVWIKLGGWRLLANAACESPRVPAGQPARLYLGLDPRLVKPSQELSGEAELLPGPGAIQPIPEIPLVRLLVWPKH